MGEIRACCGFGHRDVFENISDQLYNTLLHIAEQGCKKFYTGGMGEFDKLFSSAVRRTKSMFPDIKLICVKPYMTKDINENGEYLLTLYDDIIIPTELADVHYKAVIQKRNQWMIEESDLLVFYARRKYGGAYDALRYAKRNKKTIVLL
ncbi:MAG: SLOG family protein [Ruminococcus sp.]|nr:SLOG family protein [Ruminococcus sp.]